MTINGYQVVCGVLVLQLPSPALCADLIAARRDFLLSVAGVCGGQVDVTTEARPAVVNDHAARLRWFNNEIETCSRCFEGLKVMAEAEELESPK